MQILARNISYEFGGMAEETEEVNKFMIGAGLTAVFIMLLMLLTQFNSFYQSFIILIFSNHFIRWSAFRSFDYWNAF